MKRFWIMCFVVGGVLLFPTQLMAQDSLDLVNPYRALYTFLYYLNDEAYDPERASKVIYEDHASRDQAVRLAIRLKQVLDARGLWIDLDSAPRDPAYVDSAASMMSRYTIHKSLPEVYLERIEGKWYFSRSTTSQIGRLHKETFPYGTDRLLNLLPKAGNYKILGIKVWQYLGVLFIVLFAFLFHWILRSLIATAISGLLKRYGSQGDVLKRIKPSAISASYSVVFVFVKIVVPVLQFPVELARYVNLTISALIPFFVMIALYRFVDVLDIFFTRLSEKTESTLDDQLVPLVRKALKAFVIIIGVLVILQNLRIDIIPLLAGLSVGGVAVALAAQDTIKNFFGSIMIFVDKPFQVGHWITFGGVDGTVEEVGIRSTRVRTFRNSVVYVPNGLLADGTIDNHGLRVYRRFFTQISITYDTPADNIELFVEGLRKIVADHPETRKDYYEIHLNEMAASSLNIMFYIFFEVPTWSDELRCRHEILLSVIRLAETMGINFAFPTQTLHIENLPGQASLSPTYEQASTLRPKIEQFLKDKGLRPEN